METLTNKPPRYGFVPAEVMEFFEGGYRRARAAPPTREGVVGASERETRTRDARDADGDRTGDEARDHADARRLMREVEWERRRGTGTERRGTGDEDGTWTRVRGCEFGDALPEPWAREMEGKEESDVERRERACANRLMDMIEKDLRACLPALSMFTRMDQNVDAFEAFLDDMERRFARGTLPKRDALGDLIVVRWRVFVLVFVATTTATFVGATRMLLRAVM